MEAALLLGCITQQTASARNVRTHARHPTLRRVVSSAAIAREVLRCLFNLKCRIVIFQCSSTTGVPGRVRRCSRADVLCRSGSAGGPCGPVAAGLSHTCSHRHRTLCDSEYLLPAFSVTLSAKIMTDFVSKVNYLLILTHSHCPSIDT